MHNKKNIKLNLNAEEKLILRKNKLKMADLQIYSADEIESLLDISTERAKEIHALAEFQTIPSVGIKFAEDLIFLGYYSIEELKNTDPSLLLNEYEKKKGYWTDPCVEDQFRLAVYVADTGDYSKNWWDFTEVRKKFRSGNGYPADRPQNAWFELLENS